MMKKRSNLLLAKKTLNFAHRGLTHSAPENSLAAFQAAIDAGADGIELDVRTCKTGEVVVFHDPTLVRMTNGRGFVKNKALGELQSFFLNSQNSQLMERIPTLAQVLELTKDKVLLNIEIKTNGLPKNHIEDKVVRILRDYGAEYETIISSFNPIVMRRIRKIDEQIMTGYLVDKNFTVRNAEIPLTKFAGAKAIHLEKTLAKEKLVSRIHELGFYSVIWSVNEPDMMVRFIEWGVNAIITDHPERLRKCLLNHDAA